MKLSDFKQLNDERTPGEWDSTVRVRFVDEDQATKDAQFIAACTVMIPRLLAVVEALSLQEEMGYPLIIAAKDALAALDEEENT